MKTTDQASDRIIVTKSSSPRWYRVRPVFLKTFALSVATWLGVLGYGVLRGVGSADLLATAARILARNGSFALDALALASVVAVIVVDARTTRCLAGLRRRLARSMRITQRLVPGARPARA